MNKLKQQLDYSLVIYDDNGSVLEKLDGPGDCGMWFWIRKMDPLWQPY